MGSVRKDWAFFVTVDLPLFSDMPLSFPRPNGAKFLLLSVLIIVLDQITKYLCVFNIPYNTRGIEVLPFFNIIHVYNYGAAFSMFASWDGAQRILLSAIAIIMAAIFTVVLLRTKREVNWHCLFYALLFCGGNGKFVYLLFPRYCVDFFLFFPLI